MAPLTRIAFSNALRVRICEGFRSSCTICTIRGPKDARAGGGAHRRPDKRRFRARSCRAIPPSTPWSKRCPSSCNGQRSGACRFPPRRNPRATSHRRARLRKISRHRCLSPKSVHGSDRSASGRPETRMVGRSQLAAPISSEGVVLSQPASSTTASIGLPRMLSSTSSRRDCETASRWGGDWFPRTRTPEIPAARRLLPTRRFSRAGRVRGNGDCRGVSSEIGVANADDGPAIERIVRQAAILHQERWMKLSRSSPPNQACERRRFFSATPYSPFWSAALWGVGLGFVCSRSIYMIKALTGSRAYPNRPRKDEATQWVARERAMLTRKRFLGLSAAALAVRMRTIWRGGQDRLHREAA